MDNFKIILIGVLMFPAILFGQGSNGIVTGEKHLIHSEIFGDDIEYWVHLPVNYENSTARYPVLYITDGGEHFYLASGTTGFMSSQFVIPELIVVAIFHKDRKHDLTPTHCIATNEGFESDGLKVSGGGEKFLQFIEKELIIQIERDYRTAPYRILSGHSLGGLFAVYAYLNRNELFDAFIAMDPALTWDHHLCERLLRTSTHQSPDLHNKLYVSSAHNAPYGEPDKSPFRLSQDSFFKALEAKQVSNTKHDYFEDQNHMTVPYQSLYAGLSFIFPGFYILDDPQFVLEVPFVQEFYTRQSDLYGIEIIPPERYSSSAFECLARAYKALGDTVNADLNLKKALELER